MCKQTSSSHTKTSLQIYIIAPPPYTFHRYLVGFEWQHVNCIAICVKNSISSGNESRKCMLCNQGICWLPVVYFWIRASFWQEILLKIDVRHLQSQGFRSTQLFTATVKAETIGWSIHIQHKAWLYIIKSVNWACRVSFLTNIYWT